MKNKMISKQLNTLFDQIYGNVPPTGDRMLVFPIEAGLGKTTTAVKALWAMHDSGRTDKSLLVVPQIEDAKKLAKKLKGIAISLHGDKFKKIDIRTILDTPVIIITHQRYIRLCNKKFRQQRRYRSLIEGRKNLIVDEEIPIEEPVEVSISDYWIVKNSLEKIDSAALDDFIEVFSEAYDWFVRLDNENMWPIIYEPMPLSKAGLVSLDRIKKKVYSKANNRSFFNHLNSIRNESENYWVARNFSELSDVLEKLTKLVKSSSWYCGGNTIQCTNKGIHYVLLENNILLDASASMSEIYKHIPIMDVVPMERLVSHENWTLKVCDINTSGSGKEGNAELYNDIASLIQKILSDPHKKLLVVGSAKDVGKKEQPNGYIQRLYPELQRQFEGRISFANFAAVRGKNNWADYNCCLIIHTPYLPGYQYPLKLQHHRPDVSFSNDDMRLITKAKRSYLAHRTLNALRETILAACVYQAAKRINRDGKAAAQVFLLTSNQRLVKTVAKNMLGIKVEKFSLPSQKRKDGKRAYIRTEENPTTAKLRKLFKQMASGKHRAHECPGIPGHYTKAWCKEKIGYTGANFIRYLGYLQEDMLRLGIASSQHKIIVLRDVKKD